MKRYKFALGVLILALAISAVLLVLRTEAADLDRSHVRLVHAAPDAPAVDVWVDGVEVSSNVSYMTVTPYETLSAGPHLVQVMLSGLPIPVVSQTLVLTGGMDFTVAGAGQGMGITAAVLEDDNSPANNNTVRFVNLSSDTPAIDVVVVSTLGFTTTSDIPFLGTSPYVGGLGGGVTSFEVHLAGQITPLLTFTRTLEEDTINSLFIMGLTTPPGSAQFPLTAVHSVDRRFSWIFLPTIVKGG
jgi:hypothetical protein